MLLTPLPTLLKREGEIIDKDFGFRNLIFVFIGFRN